MTRPIPTDWQPPTELRCIGGPAESNWYEVPPQGYIRREIRGGAYWEWNPEAAQGVFITGGLGVMGCGTLSRQRLATRIADRPIPPSALPCESGPEPKP